jgi:hypothetical protein
MGIIVILLVLAALIVGATYGLNVFLAILGCFIIFGVTTLFTSHD